MKLLINKLNRIFNEKQSYEFKNVSTEKNFPDQISLVDVDRWGGAYSSDVWSLSRCLAAAQFTSPAGQRKFPGPGPQQTE